MHNHNIHTSTNYSSIDLINNNNNYFYVQAMNSNKDKNFSELETGAHIMLKKIVNYQELD